ncbi:flagellar basal-body MS-ring/collar protein FliF [Sulfurimonas sp. HSL-1716]|uniref:flagellar basal-body MS-ring/collar protein FliF n=1 Tax=Hydrocurvibacter sulfurireducens TaxID=3131937 RepID=UPI0031F9372F
MDFKVLFSQLVVLYSKLSKAQRIIIGGAIVGIVAFLVFLVVFTSKGEMKDNYEILFEKLSNEDAAKVVQQLDKENVPYSLSDNNTIKVPKNIVYKQRISIASMGIPTNKNVGFELFDSQEFGATSFDQNVKYLRALEGELSRTISALDPVEGASVSLALPKETLFVSKQTEPTASVMVKLKDGRTLTPKQIRGIKNLVASAVPKLTIENVALINSNGEVLGDNDDSTQLGELSVVEQRYKSKEEKKSEQKIVDVLAPFLGGSDHVVAKVTIEYDFSQKSSTSEKYDPENVVRSEQTVEEKREGSTPAKVGGVPGTVSNIGPVQGLKSNTTTDKYQKNSGTTNYEISKTVSTQKDQFARIKRITAAVVVDGKYQHKVDKNGNPTNEMEYVALDQSQLDAIASLVSQSIGINQERGDQVSIKNFQFKSSGETATGNEGITKFVSFTDMYITPFASVFKYAFVLIILFVLYKKVISPFAERMLEISREDEDIERPVLAVEDDEDDDLVERVQEMRKKVEDQLGVGQNFNEDELKYDVLLEKIKTIADDHPEDIAALIQSLLSEESVANTPSYSKLEGL